MSKVNYYFISSPLHLMFCVGIAIKNGDATNIAIIDYYLEDNRRLFVDTLNEANVFDTVISFEDSDIKSKFLKRRARLKKISNLVSSDIPTDLYTGSDRSVEFQYAIYCATKYSTHVKGHYLDEGTQTYLGHRHMNSFAHTTIDPFLKKLMFGFWWDSPRMIGASKWVSSVFATFPELVHPFIRDKAIYPMPKDYFSNAEFLHVIERLLDNSDTEVADLQHVKFVILLTGDAFYKDVNNHLDSLVEILSGFVNQANIALKAHPRSSYIEQFKTKHPDLIHIDNRVGFEFLLTQFPSDCIYIGDVSSALFTIKWLKSEQSVFSVKLEQTVPEHFNAPLKELFRAVDVPQLSYAELLTHLTHETDRLVG